MFGSLKANGSSTLADLWQSLIFFGSSSKANPSNEAKDDYARQSYQSFPVTNLAATSSRSSQKYAMGSESSSLKPVESTPAVESNGTERGLQYQQQNSVNRLLNGTTRLGKVLKHRAPTVRRQGPTVVPRNELKSRSMVLGSFATARSLTQDGISSLDPFVSSTSQGHMLDYAKPTTEETTPTAPVQHFVSALETFALPTPSLHKAATLAAQHASSRETSWRKPSGTWCSTPPQPESAGLRTSNNHSPPSYGHYHSSKGAGYQSHRFSMEADSAPLITKSCATTTFKSAVDSFEMYPADIITSSCKLEPRVLINGAGPTLRPVITADVGTCQQTRSPRRVCENLGANKPHPAFNDYATPVVPARYSSIIELEVERLNTKENSTKALSHISNTPREYARRTTMRTDSLHSTYNPDGPRNDSDADDPTNADDAVGHPTQPVALHSQTPSQTVVREKIEKNNAVHPSSRPSSASSSAEFLTPSCKSTTTTANPSGRSARHRSVLVDDLKAVDALHCSRSSTKASTTAASSTLASTPSLTVTSLPLPPTLASTPPRFSHHGSSGIDQLIRREFASRRHLMLSDFELRATVGTGTFGRVRLAKLQGSLVRAPLALKILKKSEIIRLKQVEHVKSEKTILTRIQHPFIVNLFAFFQDSKRLFMVMEFIHGGELFSYLRREGRLENAGARFYAAEILLALQYLHSADIVYRDLKPENLLIDGFGHIKLTDFGFAKVVHDRTWTVCGTPEYLAPEVIKSVGHGKPVDWWAFGILIFEMLAGYPPFYDESPFGIYQKVLSGKITHPRHVDPRAKDLIKRLLTLDRTKRLGCLKGGAEDIKKHKWFRSVDWNACIRRQMEPPFIPPTKAPDDTSMFDEYPESTEGSSRSITSEEQALFEDF